MNAIQSFNPTARALAPSPWIVETAQIQSKSFGYHVLHPVGDGPDDVTATLYDFACQNPVSGPEVVSIEDETYSQTFDNFTYDIDIHPDMIYNSSLVSFDTSDPSTGFSIGHIQFCSLVLTKMQRPGFSDLDVSYLKTKFDVTFNLTNNAFGTDGQLELPSQNVTFPTSFTVNGVNPANPAQAANITNALAQAILSQLVNVTIPPGMTIVVDTSNSTFGNGQMNTTASVGLQYNCNDASSCATQNAIAQACLPNLLAALLNALNNGSVANALNNIANTNNIPGINNATIPSTVPPPTTPVQVPISTQGSTLQQSSTAPASLTVANVTAPTSQAEEDAMVSTVQQAVTNILANVPLPSGFTLNVNAGNASFANGNMGVDLGLTVSYPCSTQAECDSIENDDMPGIMAALIAALQNAISNGTLNNQIQALAQQNGTTGLNNASVPATGGVNIPSTTTQVPVTTTPGSVAGLSASSSAPGTLNLQNVSAPATPAAEAAMINAVQLGINAVLQTFAPTLPDGFDIFVDISSASFVNGTMSNNLNITISYPCANQAQCNSINSNQVPAIIATLMPLLQQAISNGTLGNAISNAANQIGAPGLNNPSIPLPGGVIVPTTTVQGPVTVPGQFTGTSQSTSTPVNLTIQNVSPPSNPAQQNAMVNAVQQGINNVVQSLPGIPAGFNVSVDLTNVSFQNGTMDNDLNITITYPCASQTVCNNINNLLVPGIISNILAGLQAAANNGSLAAAIQNAANQNGAPGLSNTTIPSGSGGVNFPTTNVQAPVTNPGPISGLFSSTSLPANFTVNNVIPPANQAEEDAMVDIVEEAIETVLQSFTASLPDGFDFFVDATGVSFQNGDMLNNLNFTISYPCSNQAECDSIESGIVPGLVNNFLALLQVSIDNGSLTALIQNLAALNGVSNLLNASVSSGGGGISVPTSNVQTPTTTSTTILSADVDATFTVGNVTPPSNQAEEDAMVAIVEQAISNVLSNFTANLPPGFALSIDVTDATFSNGNMDNDLTFQFTAPCSSSAQCSALGPQFQSLTNQLLALLQVAINNGSLAAQIQSLAAQNGTPGLNNATTPSGSLTPTLTLPAPGPSQVNGTITQNPTSGLIDSTVVSANLNISVFVPTSTPVQQAIVTSIFENSVASVLSNFTSSLPAGFSLDIDVTNSVFSGNNMANAIDFTFIYPCANQASCDSIESNVIPGLVASLLAALNNAIGSGALANAMNQGLTNAGLTPSQPTLTPNLPVVPTVPGGPLVITNPPVTLGQSVISANMTVSNVPPPANNTVAQAMAAVVEAAVDSVLTNFTNNILPPGFNLVVNVTDTTFANGNMLNNIDFAITYPCTDDCDYIHTHLIPSFIQALIAALTNAINNGSLNAALTSIAATNGVPGFSNPSAGNLQVPTTTVQMPITTTGPFTGVLPDDFSLDIFTQFSVTACQCDDFTLQCLATPQPLLQNQVFAICIIPSDDSVFVSNMELFLRGSNGFEYQAVQFGSQTYVPSPPITTVTYTQTVLVKTYLVAGFFTENGGSNDVVVTGTASLENKPGKTTLKTQGSKEFAFAIPLQDGLPKQEEDVGFMNRLILIFQTIFAFIRDFLKNIF